MERRKFIRMSSLAVAAYLFHQQLSAKIAPPTPLEFYFKDDGFIPNNKLPLLVYKNVFSVRSNAGADWLEKHFNSNDWSNTWRWGVYPFHHFHSNTHEVLGVYQGTALLQMGGEKGKKMNVSAGDILVIPAGVGHKCLSHSDDFMVVGAYPFGLTPDLMRGNKSDRPQVDKNIANARFPKADPYVGNAGGLMKLWK